MDGVIGLDSSVSGRWLREVSVQPVQGVDERRRWDALMRAQVPSRQAFRSRMAGAIAVGDGFDVAGQGSALHGTTFTESNATDAAGPAAGSKRWKTQTGLEGREVPFRVLRSLVHIRKRAGEKAGHFLLLGSASCDVLEHSTETLAGRIWHLKLSPLSIPEVYQHDPQGIEVDKL